MKKSFGAAMTLSALSAFSGTASASDWSGHYVGLNAGYFWSSTDAAVSIPGTAAINATARAIANGALTGVVDGDGFTGGVTLGVNGQTDDFVFGIEADVNYLDLGETRDSGIVPVAASTGRGRDQLDGDFLATLRLRAGFAASQTLFYLTGGFALTDADISRTLDWSFFDDCPPVGGGLQRCHSGLDDFDIGWTAGVGVEHSFDPRWSVKVEYLYADFGEESFTTLNAGTVANQPMLHSFDLDMHIVRLGVNYHL